MYALVIKTKSNSISTQENARLAQTMYEATIMTLHLDGAKNGTDFWMHGAVPQCPLWNRPSLETVAVLGWPGGTGPQILSGSSPKFLIGSIVISLIAVVASQLMRGQIFFPRTAPPWKFVKTLRVWRRVAGCGHCMASLAPRYDSLGLYFIYTRQSIQSIITVAWCHDFSSFVTGNGLLMSRLGPTRSPDLIL